MKKVKVQIFQTAPRLGDIEGNTQRIINAALKAEENGIEVLLTPELSLCGSPCEDLLMRDDFIEKCGDCLETLRVSSTNFPHVAVVVGLPMYSETGLINAAVAVRDGYVLGIADGDGCAAVPEYFDEQSGGDMPVFEAGGINFAVALSGSNTDIEADADMFCKADDLGADVLLMPTLFNYEEDDLEARILHYSSYTIESQKPLITANAAGGQDELVFDGRSFAADEDGLKVLLPDFEEAEQVLELAVNDDGRAYILGDTVEVPEEDLSVFYNALVCGLRSYVEKCGFRGIVLGLSGGIDSALVLKLAVDAVGADRVEAVMMPSKYTSRMSLDDAAALASNLGVKYEIIPITPAFETMKSMLSAEFEGYGEDVTEENMQARIRGMLLMAISNKKGLMVAATGNKSEMAVGYTTLYGDLAGGFAPIKDVLKTRVYQLCVWLNSQSDKPLIPENIIMRAPSAELRDNQTDQDSLPEYIMLDVMLHAYIVDGRSADELVEAGFDRAVVERVIKMVRTAEYKRRQAPIGTRVSRVSFGREWRYPIVNAFR